MNNRLVVIVALFIVLMVITAILNLPAWVPWVILAIILGGFLFRMRS